MVDSPRGVIDPSLMMMDSAQVSTLTTNRDKNKGKITIRGDASFDTSGGGQIDTEEGSIL